MPSLAWATVTYTILGWQSFEKQVVTGLIWPIGKRGKRDIQTGMLLDPQRGGAIAVIQRHGARLRLLHRARCDAPDDGNWRPAMASLLGGYREPINAVAPDDTYQLLLVDRPDVPDAEVAAAVRWRIRDLIDGPVDESVVDVFDLPAQARGSRNMVYAVATGSDSVAQIADQIRDCGAPLASIDIAELCLRNIAVTLEQDRFGVAFLLVHGRHGVLTVSRDKKLYVIRQMEIPLAGPDLESADNAAMSGIALELQRSLDYFESHYDQRPIRDVVLAPSADGMAICSALARELAVNVSMLDLNDILETPVELSGEEQADCLLAIGAALRGPDVVAAPGEQAA